MPTMYDGPAILSSPAFQLPADTTWRGGLFGFSINGPFNGGTVLKSDTTDACKVIVTLIDAVLLPFDPVLLELDGTPPVSSVVGATGASVRANSLITGQEVVPGANNLQSSVGECATSCRANPRCNAFSFCALRGGCEAPGNTLPFGYCQLKQSNEVAAGRAPNYSEVSAITGESSSSPI
jgi:hypothetical protein